MKKLLNLLMVAFLAVTIQSCSFTTVQPGEEAFMFRPWSGGIDTNVTFSNGTQTIAMWNDMIIYNTLQQSRNYSSKVLEKNGMEIGIDITINYNPMKGRTSKLHLLHGIGYETSFIDAKVKGAIKDVIGRYTYEEIYSTKRDLLESEIDNSLKSEFSENFITFNFNEIADVNLHKDVNAAITAKETQKQNNQKAKELDEEQKYIANAKRTTASGNKDAMILEAEGRAKEIELVQKQLSKSPQYTDYIKWKGYADGGDAKVSPFGNNNVFGAGSASVIKGLK